MCDNNVLDLETLCSELENEYRNTTLKFEYYPYEIENDSDYIEVSFSQKDWIKKICVDNQKLALEMLKNDMTKYRFSKKYNAFYNDKVIEVSLEYLGSRLPILHQKKLINERIFGELFNSKQFGKIECKESTNRIEISRESNMAKLLLGPSILSITLKIYGENFLKYDSIGKFLEDIANNIFMQIDSKSNIPLSLEQYSKFEIDFSKGKEYNHFELKYPSSSYNRECMEMYWYARNSRYNSLTEYFSYYQCVEYYFSKYKKKGLKEKEVIIEIIEDSVDGESLKNFIKSDEDLIEYYGGMNSQWRKISEIRIDTKSSDTVLLRNISRRIYDIRCRIVHKKSGQDILLPSSDDIDGLKNDSRILRFISEKVIIKNIE